MSNSPPQLNNTLLSRLRGSLLGGMTGPLVGLLLVVLFFAAVDSVFADGTFFRLGNLRDVTIGTCVVAMAALGMTMIIISGGIDLSAGTALTLCATTLAWGLREDVAFLVSEGDNFAGASHALADAQRELAASNARLAELEKRENVSGKIEIEQLRREYFQKRDEQFRGRLRRFFDIKLSRLRTLEAAAAPRADAARQSYAPLATALEEVHREYNAATADSPAKRALAVRVQQAERRMQLPKLQWERWGGRQEQLRRDIRRLEAKSNQFNDPTFVLKADDVDVWSQGIPNAAATPLLAVGLGLLTGVLAGLLNGLLISFLRVVPFIVTLGTMLIFLGLGNLVSNNVTIRPSVSDQVPFWLQDLVSASEKAWWWGSFPTGVFLVLAMAALLAMVLRWTVFGRHIFALGSNEATARLCGISLPWTKVAVYAAAGLFFGVAGMCHFATEASGNPPAGQGLELWVIAAVVIGGGSLSGGRGTVVGTLTGAAIMAVIISACDQLGMNTAYKLIILGGVLILAAWIDQIRQRRLSLE